MLLDKNSYTDQQNKTEGGTHVHTLTGTCYLTKRPKVTLEKRPHLQQTALVELDDCMKRTEARFPSLTLNKTSAEALTP